jgi:hypothetical protein
LRASLHRRNLVPVGWRKTGLADQLVDSRHSAHHPLKTVGLDQTNVSTTMFQSGNTVAPKPEAFQTGQV